MLGARKEGPALESEEAAERVAYDRNVAEGKRRGSWEWYVLPWDPDHAQDGLVKATYVEWASRIEPWDPRYDELTWRVVPRKRVELNSGTYLVTAKVAWILRLETFALWLSALVAFIGVPSVLLLLLVSAVGARPGGTVESGLIWGLIVGFAVGFFLFSTLREKVRLDTRFPAGAVRDQQPTRPPPPPTSTSPDPASGRGSPA